MLSVLANAAVTSRDMAAAGEKSMLAIIQNIAKEPVEMVEKLTVCGFSSVA